MCDRMRRLVLSLLTFAFPLCAATTPASVAALVTQADPAAQLTAALHDATPLVRSTAARVIGVRNLDEALPALRETVAKESDATAAREEIRALALLGTDDDVATAVATSAKWPPSMDDALALAVARRGGEKAIDAYVASLHTTRMKARSEFFMRALWGHLDLVAYAGSRLLGMKDAGGWLGLLGAVRDSDLTMDPEPIRLDSIRYLVNGYAEDPSKVRDPLRAALLEPRTETASDLEDFGRELLRRMLGAERNDNERWLKWLESDEADRFLGTSQMVLQYLTDAEYKNHQGRCAIQSADCRLPVLKPSAFRIPSQTVALPAFNLPDVLPAGLTTNILSDSRCRELWIGVTHATVDSAGRFQDADLKEILIDEPCRRALDTILRLSYATNTSMRSPFKGPVLLAKATNVLPCLDEAAPQYAPERLLKVGGDVKAPIKKKQVEPQFPASARYAMAGGKEVLVILECVISHDGCIRSVRVVRQSPFAELNAAAVLAVTQWKFVPAYFEGQPVDVLFNLTVQFKTR